MARENPTQGLGCALGEMSPRLILPLWDTWYSQGGVCLWCCSPVWHLCFPRKFLKVQCLESGQWEEGHCIPVVCEPPPPVFEGMYNCTQGFELDSQCVLNCEPQGQQVSDVGERQRWAKCHASVYLKTAGVPVPHGAEGSQGSLAIPRAKCPCTIKQQLPCKTKPFLAGYQPWHRVHHCPGMLSCCLVTLPKSSGPK